MLPRIKTWALSFGRLIQSSGPKELKPNAVSRPLVNQRQLFELPQKSPSQATQRFQTYEEVWLREFFSKNFPVVKTFSPLPAPTWVRCSKLATSKLLFGGSNRIFVANKPVFERNLPGFGFQRNFCSAPRAAAHFANTGGIMSQLAGKSFTVAANKTNISSLQHEAHKNNEISQLFNKSFTVVANKTNISSLQHERHNKNEKPQIVNPSKIVSSTTATTAKKTEFLQPFSQTKSAVIKHVCLTKETVKNPKCGTMAKQTLKEKITPIDDNVQIYMSLNVALTSGKFIFSNNSIKKNSVLDSSFIQNFDDIVKRQHQVILDTLEKLSRLNKILDIQFLDFELRVVFPRGMDIKKVQELLKNLGIDLENPVFSLGLNNNVAKPLDNINQSSNNNSAQT
ncbi:4867_t:CDS:2, partial [Ambispora gerdemannii]